MLNQSQQSRFVVFLLLTVLLRFEEAWDWLLEGRLQSLNQLVLQLLLLYVPPEMQVSCLIHVQ